jgi:hypothetical protein
LTAATRDFTIPFAATVTLPRCASEIDSRFSFGTVWTTARCRRMKRFFFDLAGELPARDFRGHECSSKKEAKRHASFIAHRIGTEKPSFAKPGNRITVRDDTGAAFFDVPITSSTRHL